MAFEFERPRSFYLKKWFIIIMAVVQLSYCILMGATVWIEMNSTLIDDKSANYKYFNVYFLILVSAIPAIGEIIGFFGAHREVICLVKLYLVYCIIRCVIIVCACIVIDYQSAQVNLPLNNNSTNSSKSYCFRATEDKLPNSNQTDAVTSAQNKQVFPNECYLFLSMTGLIIMFALLWILMIESFHCDLVKYRANKDNSINTSAKAEKDDKEIGIGHD